MLTWSYDDEGASADMPGLDNPTFFVNRALVGSGYVAMEFFPGGLRVLQPVSSLFDGIAWCEAAAQQCVEPTEDTSRY